MSSLIPTSLNWASTNNPLGFPVVSSIHNQGLCGACWAFVSVAAVEASVTIRMRKKVSLSVQELVDCDRRINKGCFGGDPSSAFRYISSYGISYSEDYPYIEVEGKCHPQIEKRRAYITGSISLTPFSSNALMTTLALMGPVATGICGTDKSFMYYQDGIFSNENCCRIQNHAVLIIGYGKDEKLGIDYWILQNSWGPYWGENGYMRILRTNSGDSGLCGIDTVPSVPYGPYIVNDKNDSDNDDTSESLDSNHELLLFWNRLIDWLTVHWKDLAALISSFMLTISVVMLMYTIYLDHHPIGNI